jgi:hypothetical protein
MSRNQHRGPTFQRFGDDADAKTSFLAPGKFSTSAENHFLPSRGAELPENHTTQIAQQIRSSQWELSTSVVGKLLPPGGAERPDKAIELIVNPTAPSVQQVTV